MTGKIPFNWLITIVFLRKHSSSIAKTNPFSLSFCPCSITDRFDQYVRSTSQASIKLLEADNKRSTDRRILKLAADSIEIYNSEYIVGISHLVDGSYLGWFNHQMYHTSALVLNMIHNVFLGAEFNIDVTNAPLKFVTSGRMSKVLGFGISFGMIFSFSLSFYSSTFIMYYIKVTSRFMWKPSLISNWMEWSFC